MFILYQFLILKLVHRKKGDLGIILLPIVVIAVLNLVDVLVSSELLNAVVHLQVCIITLTGTLVRGASQP